MPILRGSGRVPLYVYDPNPQGREAIVLVHGWPLNHQMYEYQFSALREYRCIAPDLRGFGRSEAPAGPYDYDAFADDLAAVVRQLGLRSFTLVGFSMGGAIVLRYMKRHRGQGVKKLIFLSAAAPSFTQKPDFPYGLPVEQVQELIEQGMVNRPAMLDAFGQLFLQPGTDQSFRDWCTMLNLQASGVGTMQSLITLRDADLREDTQAVRVPTGIFHGKQDRICLYELGQQLHQMIPSSHLFSFEHSGHCIWHDELELFNRELKAFISA